MSMRIGIDARLLGYRQAGIGKYTRQLIEHLVPLATDEQFVVLHSRKDGRSLVDDPHFERRATFTPPHHRLEQWILPLETYRLGFDLLHSPDFIPPFRRNYKSIITVHDLAFLKFPHFVTKDSAHHYGHIDQAVRNTDHIIAVSHSTREDIVALLGADEEKITVIHEAADPIFQPISDETMLAEVRARHSLNLPYIFFLSTIEPRKNLTTLLHAFRQLLDAYPTVRGVTLAIAGEKGWFYEEVFDTIESLRLGDAVRYLGRVPLADLPALLNGATAHVHPSFYEGFGLTPLEAMATGTPTIVSNVSSLPEVVGDAGLQVPPEDVEAWADAIYRMLSDEELRTTLSEKGLKRAAQFSWHKAAQQHLDLYHKIVG